MLGVIGLDTGFPKYPGHVRNPSTFTFPIIVEAVKGATTERLVGQADASLEELFVGAAKRLVEQGATVITGGCGYMILFQKAIAAAVPVPVMMSSLMQVPLLATLIPQGHQLGILVANQFTFNRNYLIACGAENMPVRVWGMAEKSEFTEVMLRQERTNLDMNKLEDETIEAAQELISKHPEVACMVFECTDLAPYAASVQSAISIPVFDITTLANFVYAGHRRSHFVGD